MTRELNKRITFISLLALVLISSCSNKVADINEEVSSFDTQPVQLIGAVEHKSMWPDSAWNDLPNSAIYKLQTCLTDRAIYNPIRDESFQVSSPLKTQIIKTNVNGCLVWNERIEFNVLEQERQLSFPVTITGLSHYKGNSKLELVLNPWPNASTPMKFENNNTLSSDSFPVHNLFEKNEAMAPVSKNLEISALSISKKPTFMSNEAKVYPMDVQFKTSVVVYGLNGEKKDSNISISKGRYKINFRIIETPDGENTSYLISSSTKDATAENGLIQETIEFNVPNNVQFNDSSEINLEVELIPLNAPKGISKEFVKVSNFNLDSPSASSTVELNELTRLTVRPSSATPDPEESTVIGEEIQGDDSIGYYIKKVTNIRRGSIVSNSYNKSSTKIRRAKFTLCLNEETASANQVALSDTQVRVDVRFPNGKSDNPEKDRIYKTNEDGCLDSYANITYDKYSLERWIPFNVVVTPLSGTYTELIKTRKLTVNPWNPEDFGYDTKYETEIPEIKAHAPRLFVGSVDYKKDMMDYTSFRVNEYLHLSLKKKYQFTFSPQVELFHSYKDDSLTEALTFGEYEVKISLFSPKSPEIDYYNPNLENFKYITSASKNLKIKPNGTITDLISFPFLVSETQDLSYKNLAILEMRPLDKNSSIRPVKVVFPFFGGNKGAVMPAMTYEKEISSAIRKVIDHTVANGKELPSVDVMGDPSVDPMANFAYNFKSEGQKLNPSIIIKDMRLDEFNKSAPIANWERVRLPEGQSLKGKVQVTTRELRTLVTENAKAMPKGILGKFCRHFYDLPNIKRDTQKFLRVEKYDGGEKYVDCTNKPNDHFTVTPVTHIRKILSRKPGNPNEAYASYVESTRGQVSRGNAFFAAYGDRASTVSGEREGESTTTNMSYGIEGPGPYYFGYSKGHVKEYATFEQKNRADMEAAFDRFYTQRSLSELEFDLLKLKFYAQVRRCVTIVGNQSNSARVHLCEDNDRPKQVEEEWYFIGDTRSRDHGMIADGAFPGLTGFTQVIRGRYNYNRMWNKYKEEDIKLVLQEVGETRGVSYAFKRYLKESETGAFFENFIDNSHPGLYIKPRY